MTEDELIQFDEEFYLANNPDAAAMVASGEFPSGLAHFRERGERERRQWRLRARLSGIDIQDVVRNWLARRTGVARRLP